MPITTITYTTTSGEIHEYPLIDLPEGKTLTVREAKHRIVDDLPMALADQPRNHGLSGDQLIDAVLRLGNVDPSSVKVELR